MPVPYVVGCGAKEETVSPSDDGANVIENLVAIDAVLKKRGFIGLALVGVLVIGMLQFRCPIISTAFKPTRDR